eukprot:gnl/MRDRNA2_/MRDRNA2_32871_c0_seq1.p1 gnl/MRDRNA2_/MRDRNA2_32871_c0~~gnl/MRDRNA2_/MRDRNA2_32871_c0_seq1.p1  ORF type:complete len:574 (-),score=103.82 gnl/MRDRNA2_/MRDRNA2_32871_c0_seq1:58-1779(-)
MALFKPLLHQASPHRTRCWSKPLMLRSLIVSLALALLLSYAFDRVKLPFVTRKPAITLSLIPDAPEWYIQGVEQTRPVAMGPWTVPDLLGNTGFDEFTSVWKEGMSSWTPAQEIPELKDALLQVEKADAKVLAAARQPQMATQTGLTKKERALKKAAKITTTTQLPIDSSSVTKMTEEDMLHELEELGGKPDNVKFETFDTVKALISPEADKRKENVLEADQKPAKAKKNSTQIKENTGVYVSGLPEDVTLLELAEFFKTAGVIGIDPLTGQAKIKIYYNETGKCKGDALISYAYTASVDLAIQLLHERELRRGFKVCVQKPDFGKKRGRGPKASKAPQPSSSVSGLTAEQKKKLYDAAKNEEKLKISWDTDVDDGSGRRIVVLRHMFSRQEAENGDDAFYKELSQEVRNECEKFGDVGQVTVIRRHIQGVVCVKFQDSACAEQCIKVNDGRFFAGRKIEAMFYDGSTDLRTMTLPPPTSTSTPKPPITSAPSTIDYERNQQEQKGPSTVSDEALIDEIMCAGLPQEWTRIRVLHLVQEIADGHGWSSAEQRALHADQLLEEAVIHISKVSDE